MMTLNFLVLKIFLAAINSKAQQMKVIFIYYSRLWSDKQLIVLITKLINTYNFNQRCPRVTWVIQSNNDRR
jgi:hypothetical protein